MNEEIKANVKSDIHKAWRIYNKTNTDWAADEWRQFKSALGTVDFISFEMNELELREAIMILYPLVYKQLCDCTNHHYCNHKPRSER